jgi:exonuclease SbcC
MLPLELTIKGFGPYLGVSISEEEFRLLQDSRLFLIFGEIGAGKTTLFDAILFALYGETSFPERKVEHLISHHIKPGARMVPEVGFRFLFGKEEIKVVRRLPALALKGQEAYLWINGRLLSNKLTEVNQILKDILKLEAKQFKKVLLLPQGEYREVLLAEKRERVALFERLFQLEIFSKLEEYLKEKNKELKAELDNLTTELSTLLRSCEAQSLEELKERVVRAKEDLRKLHQKEALLKEELRRREESLKRLENLYLLLERKKALEEEKRLLLQKKEEFEEKEKEVARLRAFKEILPYYEDLRRRWKELKRLKSLEKETLVKLEGEKIAFKEITERLSELEKEKERISALREKKIKLEDLFKLLQREKEANTKLESFERRLKELTAQVERLREEKEAINIMVELSKLEKEYQDLIRLKEVEKALCELEASIKDLEERLNEKKKEYEALRDLSLLQRVAERLKEGEACPLCGSTSHPHKASLSEKDVERITLLSEEIPKLEEELRKEREKRSELLGERRSLLSRTRIESEEELSRKIETLRSTLKNKVYHPEDPFCHPEALFCQPEDPFCHPEAIFCHPEDPFCHPEAQAEGSPHIKLSQSLSEDELKRDLELLENKEKNLHKEKEALLQDKARLEEQLRSVEVKFSELGYEEKPSLEKIERELSELNKEITAFERAFNELTSKKEESSRRLSGLQVKLEETRNSLKREVLHYMEALAKVFSLKKRGLFFRLSELKEAISRVASLEGLEKEVEDYKKHLFSLTESLARLEEELRTKHEDFSQISLDDVSVELKVLKENVEGLRLEKERIDREVARLEENLKRAEAIKAQVEELTQRVSLLRKEQGVLEHILSLISGKNPKAVSLPSYATSIFLDRLLRRANHYLKEFSFHRYCFVIEEALRKDFELYIFDAYTGRAREVRTLSGGESFIAVLAFALGVSDLMQALSGAKPFQSFFIDEGFGNLDSQTLDRVVQTLVEVSQRADRVIGVISHLSELKDRFPARIEVIKDREGGSRIKVEKVF